MNNPNLQRPSAPQLSITPDQLTDVNCASCNGELFTEALIIKEVSALLTGTGEPKLAPIPVFVCLNCKTILEKTLPESLRKKKIVLTQKP